MNEHDDGYEIKRYCIECKLNRPLSMFKGNRPLVCSDCAMGK